MADQLTFYGLCNDLERMLDRQENLRVDLLKLSRTYPSLVHDERFKRIHEHNEATIADYKKLMATYDAMNKDAEAKKDEPKDYYAALSYVIDTDLQETCKHPTDSWIPVCNVPADRRQYRQDDKDWLCGMCGLLVPTF